MLDNQEKSCNGVARGVLWDRPWLMVEIAIMFAKSKHGSYRN